MFSIIKDISTILLSKEWTLSTAESCTGGLISGAITEMAGCSYFFKGTVVAYDNSVKVSLLGVKDTTLVTFGAVSSQTVEEMVTGVCKLLNTDCALSISGIAGPGGGTDEKPVGLVYIGLKIKDQVWSFKHTFNGNRRKVRIDTVRCALNHLLYGIKNFSM